jgi:hypothetical protein
MLEDVETVANRLEKLNRAIAVARQRKRQNDLRAMFNERVHAALDALINAPYPFAWPDPYKKLDDVETFGDATNEYPQLRAFSPEQFRTRARVLDGRQFLFLVRLHAKQCGEELGAGQICALAACAGRAPSRASLKRLFRELESQPEIVSEFLKSLPPVTRPISED